MHMQTRESTPNGRDTALASCATSTAILLETQKTF